MPRPSQRAGAQARLRDCPPQQGHSCVRGRAACALGRARAGGSTEKAGHVVLLHEQSREAGGAGRGLTSKKLQILTQLLCWYKCTNTDAANRCPELSRQQHRRFQVMHTKTSSRFISCHATDTGTCCFDPYPSMTAWNFQKLERGIPTSCF